MVKWANFVQPKSIKDVITPLNLGLLSKHMVGLLSKPKMTFYPKLSRIISMT